MTCTQCFRKIAPSTLEKNCNGEHRQQREGEGEGEFPRGAKGVGREALPSSGFFWASSPYTQPPQTDPGLSPFWRLGEPMFPVHLRMWRETTATALRAELCPWRWGPWRRESALLSCSWPVSPAKLDRNLFLESGTFPSRPVSLVLQSLPRSSFRRPVSS